MSDPVVRREEVESALAARHELGRDYEREIADSLVERIEQRLEERHAPPPRRPARWRRRSPWGWRQGTRPRAGWCCGRGSRPTR
jgi:hypothetical protein